MRRIKIISLFATVLAIITLLILSYRVVGQIYRNHQKIDSFSYNNKMEQYQRKFPVDKMNLLEYSSYLEIPVAANSLKVPNIIDLPKKVQYFTEQDGKKRLAFEIEKGTSVSWIPSEEFNDIYIGYGLRSYPTYDKGWRYVRPFILTNQKTDVEQLTYYFVRTKDLEAVAKAAFSKYLMKLLKSQGRSVEDAIFLYTRFIDNIFYDKGVFYSPDLVRQVWHWIDTTLLCLFIGLLLLAWLLRRILRYPKKI